MKIGNTLDILIKNSLTESIDIENVDKFVGELIKEGMVKSSVGDICYVAPLTAPTGFVFSAKKEDNILKINKAFIEVDEHPIITEITQEVMDDVLKQFGENGIELLTDLIQSELYIEQDRELFKFIDDIATIAPDKIPVTLDNTESDLMNLQGYIDSLSLKISAIHKSPMGSIIIGSSRVIGLLTKMDNEINKKDDAMYSYAGSFGNRDLFVDYNATEDYITVGINSSATLRGVVFSPYSISTNYHTTYDGFKVIRVNNRYKFTRNPSDNQQGKNNSNFFIKTYINFSASNGIDFNEFLEAFNNEITN